MPDSDAATAAVQAYLTRAWRDGAAVALLAFFCEIVCAVGNAAERQDAAAYLVEIDGRIVASRAARARRQPASLAKLAAAIVVLRQMPPDSHAYRNGVVTVSPMAAAATGTRLGLAAGDRVRVRDLVAAMLVGSANDACLALAEYAADGRRHVFVTRMNQLARELDMRATKFVDPCGHDQPGQHSTATDLLQLAHAALLQDEILNLVEQRVVRVELMSGQRELAAYNTNVMLGNYNGAFGLKTGYTARAGGCVIVTVRLGGSLAIAIVLGSRDRWSQAATLLDRGFSDVLPIPRARTPGTIGEPDR